MRTINIFVALAATVLVIKPLYAQQSHDPFSCDERRPANGTWQNGTVTVTKATSTTESEIQKSPEAITVTVVKRTIAPASNGDLITTTETTRTVQPLDGRKPTSATVTKTDVKHPIPPSAIERAADCHFYLRNTINDDQQGASFSYGHDGAQHSNGFKTQFAAGYRSGPLTPGLHDIGLGPPQTLPYLLWDVDGNLATGSQSGKKNSYLNVRPEFGWDLTWPQPELKDVTAVFLRFGPMFEATQDFAVRNALAEISTTLTYLTPAGFSIGQYRPIAATGLDYRFRPYFSVQAGTNLHGLELSGELSRTRLRLIPQPILEFQLHDPGRLGLSSSVLQVYDIFSIEPLEGKQITVNNRILKSEQTHNQFTASLQFGLTPFLTFGPTYTTGAVAPFFKRDTTVTVALKLGFGESGGQIMH